MSTRVALVILHEKSCEIIEVQYGYDLMSEWLGGNMSPKQVDAMIERAKELNTIPLSDGGYWEYYTVITDKSLVNDLNRLDVTWLSNTFDCEIKAFLRYHQESACYDLFIHRDLWADDDEVEPDVRYLGR